MMNYFSHLRTFVTVYRCGSHNKASEILCLTQPAISKQITALEAKIGKELFYKNGAMRHKPTVAADNLAQELAPHIDQIEQIFNVNRSNSDSISGRISIGGLSEYIEMRLSHTIATLIPHDIKFTVQDETGKGWLRLLENNILDIAIVSRPLDTRSVSCCVLTSETLTLVARSDLLEEVGGDEHFLKIPYLSHIEKDLSTCRYLKAFFPTVDITTLRQGAVVYSFRMMKELLLTGTGFGVLPLGLVEEEIRSGSVRQISLPVAIPSVQLYLAWNNISMQQPRHIFVRDAILEAVKTPYNHHITKAP